MKTAAFLGVALALVPCVALASEDSPRFIINQRSTDRTPLPFSEGVQVGNTLYIAGHIGIDPKTDQAAQDPATEAKLVMSAVEQTVKSAGLSMDNVVSMTVFCTDLSLYETFNTAYRGFFHGHYPARAFIGVTKLLRGAHFEVQGIAVKTAAER
jgi:2-iminobutanoate/2-iminopropanoate deaminase